MTWGLDSSIRVGVGGHEVVTYSYGDCRAAVPVPMHGGRDLPCEFLHEPAMPVIDAGYHRPSSDWLGSGTKPRRVPR